MKLKFIKNVSNVDKKYFGAGVAPGQYIEIPRVYDAHFATDSNLLSDIGKREVKISKAEDDDEIIHDINDAISYLRDEYVIVGNTIINVMPKLTSKFKIDFIGQEVELTDEYQEIYSYLGKSELFSFIFKFNSSLCSLKLTIDSNVIFELSLDKLLDITKYNSNGSNIQNNLTLSIDNNNIFSFTTPYPIESFNDIKIESKQSKSNKKFESGLVFISKG